MISPHFRWRGTYRALVPVMVLAAAAQAQNPPTIPAATAPSAVAVKAWRAEVLPDEPTPFSSSIKGPGQALHVLVGRTIFIKSVGRLKRVYVSNPAAIDSFTSSPTQ